MNGRGKMNYDVVIIGGGPAGISLGNLLHKASVSCCIIDKAKFPREKLCGGLVTKKTLTNVCKIFDKVDLKSFGGVFTNEISLYHNNVCISEVNTNIEFLLVDRVKFDNELVNQYKNAGGELFENCKIIEIKYEDNYVLLQDGRKISYRVLVGADGVYSKVRKYVDAGYKPDGFCIEVSVDKKDLNFVGSRMRIYFGNIQRGYGWVFPKNDKCVVGFGGLLKYNNGDYSKLFARFCKQIGLDEDQYTVKSMHIPFGRYVHVPVKNNVLLIGDAAGLVDPISGEGLYYATLSAEIAFETISGFISNSSELSAYSKKILTIQEQIAATKKTQNFFYRKLVQRIGFSFAKGHKGFVRYICDNTLSTNDISYRAAFVKYFLHKYGFSKAL